MLHFIVNPVAGGGRALKTIPAIEAYMNKKKRGYEILLTETPMGARDMATEIVAAGSEGVICVGGDGTIHEAVGGMVKSDTPLGVVPAGSGNDFISAIDLKNGLPLEKYLDIILAGKVRVIDVIQMGRFYFTNIASIGLDAQIVSDAAYLKKAFRKSAYLVSTLKNVTTQKPVDLVLKTGGLEININATLLAVCNGKYYGGGFKIAPGAKIDDGLITLCIINAMPRPLMAVLFPLVLTGGHTKLKEVSYSEHKKFILTYEGTRKINLDGNIYELNAPLEFEIIPRALKVFV